MAAGFAAHLLDLQEEYTQNIKAKVDSEQAYGHTEPSDRRTRCAPAPMVARRRFSLQLRVKAQPYHAGTRRQPFACTQRAADARDGGDSAGAAKHCH